MHLTAPDTKFKCKLKSKLNHCDAYSNFKQQTVITTYINLGLGTN